MLFFCCLLNLSAVAVCLFFFFATLFVLFSTCSSLARFCWWCLIMWCHPHHPQKKSTQLTVHALECALRMLKMYIADRCAVRHSVSSREELLFRLLLFAVDRYDLGLRAYACYIMVFWDFIKLWVSRHFFSVCLRWHKLQASQKGLFQIEWKWLKLLNKSW